MAELKSSAGELGLSQQELRQVQEAQTLLQGQMAHLQDDNSRLNAQVCEICHHLFNLSYYHAELLVGFLMAPVQNLAETTSLIQTSV